jgi:hypothetical protein
LLYFGTLGDGYSLKGSKKLPSRHRRRKYSWKQIIFVC